MAEVEVAIKQGLIRMGGEVILDKSRRVINRNAVDGKITVPIIVNNKYKNNKQKSNKIIKTYAAISKHIKCNIRPSTIKYAFNAATNPNAMKKFEQKTINKLNSTTNDLPVPPVHVFYSK